jgi:hypothetical protein
MLLAAVLLIAGGMAAALAQSRQGGAAPPSTASLGALCDQALAARGLADASGALRARCVAQARAHLAGRRAGQQQVLCYYMIDPNQRGWSMDAQDFARFHQQQIGPCPGM